MTLRKRGLGRGLEVLLADPSIQEDAQHAPLTVDDRHDKQAKLLFENLQKEKLNLLQEAESLKHLINEFESIIRAELQ
ncbi:MAG: hypothetical protein Q8N96_11685 [Methylovulum sp.]|nr:hypothetical protein [Methylovulum sp.]